MTRIHVPAFALFLGATAAAAPQGTSLVNSKADGTQPGTTSHAGPVSDDGRYVAFSTAENSGLPGDTALRWDVFRRDLSNGTLELVSTTAGGLPGNWHSGLQSWSMDMSADGRFVAFTSGATNLVVSDANGTTEDVFVRDMTAGTTVLVSSSTSGVAATVPSGDPAISSNGRYVTFVTASAGMVAGPWNGKAQVYVKDLQTGVLELVSRNNAGDPGDGHSGKSSVSADGRFVAFESQAANLAAGDTNGGIRDVFLRDRLAGTTLLVSVDPAGNGVLADSSNPTLSDDGRFVLFSSDSPALVAGDANIERDAFLRDLTTGQTTLVSIGSGGQQGDQYSEGQDLSADGRYVLLLSAASNLVPLAGAQGAHVLRRDLLTGTTTLVSGTTLGAAVQSSGGKARISANGRFASFESNASALTPLDSNGTVLDVHLHDTQSGVASPYCWPKVNSQGCLPWMTFSGTASATSGAPFTLLASAVLNQNVGVLIYGTQSQAVPFLLGTLCVGGQVLRTPAQFSGGTTGPDDCSGTFAFDMNAHIQSGVDPLLAAGAVRYAQYWSRDPMTAGGSSLSNAVLFQIAP